MKLWKLLGFKESENREHGTLFRSLDDLLGELPDSEKKFITGTAGILSSVAYSDQHFSDAELERTRDSLKTLASLPSGQLDAIMTILATLTDELAGIEDYRYTRMINETLMRREKLALLSCCFSVASADEVIDAAEEHRIGLIAEALLLSRKDYITARSDYLEFLSVLKQARPSQ